MNFSETLNAPLVLTEGAVIERLRRGPDCPLDPHILNAGLIYHPLGRSILAEIYRDYLNVGSSVNLPMLLAAPTWRINARRLPLTPWADRPIMADAVSFVREIRSEFGVYAESVAVGGLTSCRGDAYKPEQGLAEAEAADFHTWEIQELARAGVDYLMAATLPAFPEAVGMAAAMARTDRPYIISFVIRPDGGLLDGRPLAEAMDRIDNRNFRSPEFYMVNCVHPNNLIPALSRMRPEALARLAGLQGNASPLSPEELEGSDNVESDPPERWAEAMRRLHLEFGLKILGGCCGTDQRHIAALAEKGGSQTCS